MEGLSLCGQDLILLERLGRDCVRQSCVGIKVVLDSTLLWSLFHGGGGGGYRCSTPLTPLSLGGLKQRAFLWCPFTTSARILRNDGFIIFPCKVGANLPVGRNSYFRIISGNFTFKTEASLNYLCNMCVFGLCNHLSSIICFLKFRLFLYH